MQRREMHKPIYYQEILEFNGEGLHKTYSLYKSAPGTPPYGGVPHSLLYNQYVLCSSSPLKEEISW